VRRLAKNLARLVRAFFGPFCYRCGDAEQTTGTSRLRPLNSFAQSIRICGWCERELDEKYGKVKP
jgi:uncharacterized CHY-type Zn-finger protein